MVYNFKKSLTQEKLDDKKGKKGIAKLRKTCYNALCVRRMGAQDWDVAKR